MIKEIIENIEDDNTPIEQVVTVVYREGKGYLLYNKNQNIYFGTRSDTEQIAQEKADRENLRLHRGNLVIQKRNH